MIIKKYLAKTETEAIEMAKEDLGGNAVVMNIKKVHPKGVARLFMRSKVEVTAALEENPSASVPPAPEPASHIDLKIPKETPDSAGGEQVIQDKLMTLQRLLEKQMQETDAGKKTKEGSQSAEPKQTAVAERGGSVREETANPAETASSAELAGPDDKTAAYKELIHKQLIRNEVDKEIADSVMEEVSNSLPANAAVDQILASVYQKIILMIGQPYLIHPDRKDRTQYIFFLGSTGVGKTTTIAKIASKLKLEQKAEIALVTADTYRIAAVEQLKTYANILSVPLRVIYSPEELGAMTDELDSYDVVLVDTAGRSHKNKGQIEDIRKLLDQVPIADRQVYLVLNAGTKYSDLQEIASVYSNMTDFSIIFTKLDETSSSGAMLNMKLKTKCPLSYVTWGQNVPDDIGPVDPQKVAKNLLSGNLKSE